MQRKQDGLVPIREAFGGPDGPVKAPQARHHFTQADQVHQLCLGQRSGTRPGLYGANDGAVLVACHG